MNRKKLIMPLIAVAALLTCCNEEESLNLNSPDKLISLTFPANTFSNYYSHVYHFANSMDGRLLESRELNISEYDNFEVNRAKNGPHSRFDFSRVYVREVGDRKYVTIYTYIGILPFSKYYEPPYPSYSIGQAIVNFTDVPPYNYFDLRSATSSYSYGDLSTRTYYVQLYDNLPRCIFIRLFTPSGELYKFIDGLQPDHTTTISLANMNNSFGTGNLYFEKDSFNSFQVWMGKYYYNDFESPLFPLFESTLSNPPAVITFPSLFLSGNYCQIELTGYSDDDGYSVSKASRCELYSSTIPGHVSLLDGEIYLQEESFRYKFKYGFEANDIVHLVSFGWSHTYDFYTTNNFSVTWRIYGSPSLREFIIPRIPENIINSLYNNYGISDLHPDEMKMTSSFLTQSNKANDYDEYMMHYFTGTGLLVLDEEYKSLSFIFPETKAASGKSYFRPEFDPAEMRLWKSQ